MAERSIIDTMARALANNDLSFDRWSQLDDVAHEAYRRDARAALRSLIDAGPTEAMLAAADKLESICARGNYGGTPTAEDLLDAMLRAALEEADNHG